MLMVDLRHPFRQVSIPEHLICQNTERSSILICEATVKCPQVGLEIGELGRAWNGYNMIPLVQHPRPKQPALPRIPFGTFGDVVD